MTAPIACTCPRITHRHGTNRMYQHHKCRCHRCCFAHSESHYIYRSGGRIQEADARDPIGVRRRLQALTAIGWSPTMLAEHCTLSAAYLSKLRTDKTGTWVRAATWREIADLYDRLWDKPVPGVRGNRVRTFADKLGYASPLAWDDDDIDDPTAKPYRETRIPAAERALDEVAIEEACIGRRVALTIAERAEAVRRLTERGYSVKAASQFLGTTERLITRHRTAGKAAGRGVAA